MTAVVNIGGEISSHIFLQSQKKSFAKQTHIEHLSAK